MVQRFPDSYLALRGLDSFCTRKLTLSLQMLDSQPALFPCLEVSQMTSENQILTWIEESNIQNIHAMKISHFEITSDGAINFAKCASHSKPYPAISDLIDLQLEVWETGLHPWRCLPSIHIPSYSTLKAWKWVVSMATSKLQVRIRNQEAPLSHLCTQRHHGQA